MCPGCKRPEAECQCRKETAAPCGDGIVRVGRETKGRKGKGVCIISGISLEDQDLARLARRLKSRCGSGGTVKNGVIEIQGDHRDLLVEELKKEGFTVVHLLSQLSGRHGFIIFSDEVYRGQELDPADRLPAMADINERAGSLGVKSKAYGLAGLRIGWVATRNERIFPEMAAFKDYTSICNSAPSEFLVRLALSHAETIMERNLRIIQDNLSCLDQFFRAHTDLFDWQRPKAGSIAFPLLQRGSAGALCTDLREKAGVHLLPGTLYGPEYCNAFRNKFQL